jgi:hypothetical protein
MGYYAPQAVQPERPTAVTVIAILAILYGALLLVGLPFSIMQVAGGFRMPGPGGDATARMMAQPAMAAWSRASIGLSAITGVLWVVSGIGLLRLRRWARFLTMALVVIAVLIQIVGSAITVPVTMEMMTSGSFAPGPAPPPELMRAIITVALVVVSVVMLGIAVLFLVLLTRRNVVYAFEPERDPARQAAYAQPPYTGVPDESQPPGGYPPPQ